MDDAISRIDVMLDRGAWELLWESIQAAISAVFLGFSETNFLIKLRIWSFSIISRPSLDTVPQTARYVQDSGH